MSLDLKLISRIVADKSILDAQELGLTEEDFDAAERGIYKFISEHWSNFKDVPSRDLIEQRYGLLLPTPTDSLEFWVEEIKSRSLQRNISELSVQIDAKLRDSAPQDALNILEQFVRKSQTLTKKSVQTVGQLVDEVKQAYWDAKAGKTGIQTPWTTMNNWTLGWWPGDVSFLSARLGVGKCHSRGTKILMFDGSIKNVEDVQVGDRLMGPDSKPRNVLSLARGSEEMFDVVPVKGETWGCNKSHILSLVCSGDKDKKHRHGGVYFYSVEEYLKLPKRLRDSLKLWRAGFELPEQEVEFDPYWVGLWLGDGTTGIPEITKDEPELVEYYKDFCSRNGIVLNRLKSNTAIKYTFTTKGVQKNPLRNFIRSKCVDETNQKRVPDNYRRNSSRVRAELLAGLIDTDGYLVNNTYEITTKLDGLKEDILFLARSLGLAATARQKKSSCGDFVGTYWRIFISGEIEKIPCRINRRIANPRNQKKNALVTGFKLLSTGVGNYYGFTIDGDHQYLLWDCTVTHNTFFAVLAAYAARKDNKKVLFISGEMSKKDIVSRYASIAAKMPYGGVRRGQLGQFLETNYINYLDSLILDEMAIMDGADGFRSSDVEIAIAKSDADLVVVDACYRIKANQRVKDRFENMAVVADDLKAYAVKYQKAILATTQMNRESTKKKNYGDEDIALSDVVGWVATNIFALKQEEEQKANRVMSIFPLKVREGENGGEPMVCNWDFNAMNFDEIDKNDARARSTGFSDDDDDF